MLKSTFLSSTEHQRRQNPRENQERQNLQQQGDGAGIPCVASPEKGQYAKHDKESYQHRTSLLQIYKWEMSEYDNYNNLQKKVFEGFACNSIGSNSSRGSSMLGDILRRMSLRFPSPFLF